VTDLFDAKQNSEFLQLSIRNGHPCVSIGYFCSPIGQLNCAVTLFNAQQTRVGSVYYDAAQSYKQKNDKNKKTRSTASTIGFVYLPAYAIWCQIILRVSKLVQGDAAHQMRLELGTLIVSSRKGPGIADQRCSMSYWLSKDFTTGYSAMMFFTKILT